MKEQAGPIGPDASRAEAISRQISSAVLNRALSPGDRLGTKQSLQQEYGVALGTLNEALAILQAGGLVDLRPGPGGGVFVADTPSLVRLGHSVLALAGDEETVAQCIAVRDALDPMVAAEAARHRTPSDIEELRDHLELLEQSFEADATSWQQQNWRLHRRLGEISPNKVLGLIYTGLLDYITEQLRDVRRESSFLLDESILTVHLDLVEAIIDGDADRAWDVAHHHAHVTRAHTHPRKAQN